MIKHTHGFVEADRNRTQTFFMSKSIDGGEGFTSIALSPSRLSIVVAEAADRATPAEPAVSDLLREAADREAGAPPSPPPAERSLSDLLREAAGR